MNDIDLEKLENIQEEKFLTKKANRRGYHSRVRAKAVTCFRGKQAWKHRKEATYARTHVSKGENVQLYIYKCPDCKNWHLTKSPPRQKKTVDNSVAFSQKVS